MLYFFKKLHWLHQILSEFRGDLAVAAANSRRKSDSFNDNVEIYPPEPQLVSHKDVIGETTNGYTSAPNLNFNDPVSLAIEVVSTVVFAVVIFWELRVEKTR